MYNHFFGFKERPFKLVPDPDYLFLSKSHEEALAHLKYAVLSGEGFVEIIGDVGTGKTMLCRAFLENMGPDIETAYIFNPKMDARELLMAINSEFGLSAGQDTIKALIDDLNEFLMEKKRQGQKAILLIDEAQNLTRSVLEQIRLLTNLETTRDKLLQTILVGQPELGEILDSYELRQLGQRITLSCHLKPLTFQETVSYISHRLNVAACKQTGIFTKSAIRKIHRYSRGVPRLINIACDRSLLSAYGHNQRKVTGRIAESAIQELATRGDIRRSFLMAGPRSVMAFAATVIFFIGLLFYQSDIKTVFGFFDHNRTRHEARRSDGQSSNQTEKERPASQQIPQEPKSKSPPAVAGIALEAGAEEKDPSIRSIENQISMRPEAQQAASLAELLAVYADSDSRALAVRTIISQWREAPLLAREFRQIDKDDVFIELASRLNGLYAHRVEGDLSLINKLNLPAVLEMAMPDSNRKVYLAVTGAAENTLRFQAGAKGQSIEVPFEEALEHWNGVAYVLWENFYHYRGTIPVNTTGDSIITLKMHLRDIGYTDLEINAAYDSETRSAVREVQARHGIPVDGYVGPLTKMVLYNEKSSLIIPRFDKDREL